LNNKDKQQDYYSSNETKIGANAVSRSTLRLSYPCYYV